MSSVTSVYIVLSSKGDNYGGHIINLHHNDIQGLLIV